MGLQFAMRCCIFVWALYVFFLRGRKKEKDEMGLIVFLIGVPRNIRSAKKEFGYVTVILQKHFVKI